MSVRVTITDTLYGHDLGFACTSSVIRGPYVGLWTGGRMVDNDLLDHGQRLGYPQALTLPVGRDPSPAIYLTEGELSALRRALRRRTIRMLLRGRRP